MPTNQWQDRQTSRAHYKRGQFSKLCPFTSHYRRSTHQERNNRLRHIKRGITSFDTSRRNNARLPGHDASWIGHCTTQASMLLAALNLRLNQLRQQAHQRPAASSQTHFNCGITAATYVILYDFSDFNKYYICVVP